MKIDKSLVIKFEEIQLSGKYNMFTDGAKVMSELGLDCTDNNDVSLYIFILNNYKNLTKEMNYDRYRED